MKLFGGGLDTGKPCHVRGTSSEMAGNLLTSVVQDMRMGDVHKSLAMSVSCVEASGVHRKARLIFARPLVFGTQP